ncbi:MAG TPA: response regulator, partial [Vineibacter sp.]|nr:response regulator [Vineibacter sp.]
MKHVLAVDDDPAIRAMIADYLGEHHFRVSTVASGREMARALAADPVDLVILDLQLDDEDGLEIVRDLRARSALPIIVLSGHRRDEIDRVIGL